MERSHRNLRREQLDLQAVSSRIWSRPAPVEGWISTFRNALGMSLEVFGKRLGVSKQTAHQLEKAEVDGSITLNRLRSAAEALNCDVVVTLIPRQPLQQMVRERAVGYARRQVQRAGHSMAMENQAVSNERIEKLIDQTANQLIEKSDSRLWE